MRAEVIEVAFRLFAEHGFDQTTVEQIAAEAGLSRTTFFRYFGTKEDVVLGRMAELGHDIATALDARPANEHPWLALRRAIDVVTQVDTENMDEAQKFMRLMSDACALRTHEWERTQGWQSILSPRLLRRLREQKTGADPRAAALAASAIACLNVATDSWMQAGGARPLSELVDEAMGAVSPLE
ncbi:TetR family transcriptional regulator [Pseudarthrobacter sp. O4]|uniref:TetR family transcriptional regulator n=1 Tax=Pseudarthrobacter sp. O4 TaxID=3418417 RepID=UPI003CF607CC